MLLLLPLLINLLGCFGLQRNSLSGVWLLNDTKGEYVELKADVPGGIYTDLMMNNVIPDPVLEDNDQATKWVGRTNWTYYRNFTVDASFLEHSNINIIFDGLDTICMIILNGKELGKCENMFVRYIFDIKNILQIGTNTIEVRFLSPVEVAANLAKEQDKDYNVPPNCTPSAYRGECHVNQIRKMQASFAWDWGPALASVGIWKDVYLEAFNTTVIRYVVVEPQEMPSKSSWNISVTTYLSDNLNHNVLGTLILELKTDRDTSTIIKSDVDARPNEHGEVQIALSFEIPQNYVRRWWPNGFGSQCLYNLSVIFLGENERDEFTEKIGFRTIELIQEVIEMKTAYSNMTENVGNSFYFKVNGLPIFAKGSNAIPINILPEKGHYKHEINRLLENARDCNMNMLRVWGGGVYESKYYYERADELGIMIWQDFMFACSLYPTRSEFLSNVVKEVRHQVKRIGNHPSIIMWAGNNENEAAITGNWYGSRGKEIYNKDYVKLYFSTIKPEFEKIRKNGIFIGSSPTNGIKSEEDGGISKNPYDNHYGDDHTYIYELDSFNPNIYPTPRFSSEYGFQSYPSLTSLMQATNVTNNLVMGSDFMKHRQHHPLGKLQFLLLISYQLKLPSSKSPNYTDVFIYYSQIIQAVAIKTETEHYRRYRSILRDDGTGLTMGALYWQLNDVWLAPTWSGIDSTGRWKMLQYYVRQSFAPVVVIGHLNSQRKLEITVVSDRTDDIKNATLTVSIYRWSSFHSISESKTYIPLAAGKSQNIMEIDTDAKLNELDCGSLAEARKNCFFHLKLSDGEYEIAPENFVIPDALKHLNLQKASVEIISIDQISQSDQKNFSIVLQSSGIALFVWLDCKGIAGKFSDNGFHQISIMKTIYFTSEEPTTANMLQENMTVSHMLNVHKYL